MYVCGTLHVETVVIGIHTSSQKGLQIVDVKVNKIAWNCLQLEYFESSIGEWIFAGIGCVGGVNEHADVTEIHGVLLNQCLILENNYLLNIP